MQLREITFLHTADLHLDSPMVGLRHLPKSLHEQLRDSTFSAFAKIIDIAIKRNVDFVIIAGDLFDGEDRSIRAQVRFRQQMERLNKYQIQAYIVHGNHDHLNGAWMEIKLPENVHIFSEQVETKVFTANDGTIVHLYGFSYRKRHIYDDMTVHYKKHGEADFHIGLLHGHSEGVSAHSRYAPFQINQLLEKQFDYWALGHIHQRTILHKEPYIVYPGNIQGRNRQETGEKGCYIVTLTEAGTHLEWLDVAPIIWKHVSLDGKDIIDFDALYQSCVDTLDSLRELNQKMIVSLRILEINNELANTTIETNELLELLQEEEQNELIFIYPVALTYDEAVPINRDTLAKESEFYHILFQMIDGYEKSDEALALLYEHHQGRKYLEQLTKREKQTLVKEAEATLLKLLHRN